MAQLNGYRTPGADRPPVSPARCRLSDRVQIIVDLIDVFAQFLERYVISLSNLSWLRYPSTNDMLLILGASWQAHVRHVSALTFNTPQNTYVLYKQPSSN